MAFFVFAGVTETEQKKDETDKTKAETEKTADSKCSVCMKYIASPQSLQHVFWCASTFIKLSTPYTQSRDRTYQAALPVLGFDRQVVMTSPGSRGVFPSTEARKPSKRSKRRERESFFMMTNYPQFNPNYYRLHDFFPLNKTLY